MARALLNLYRVSEQHKKQLISAGYWEQAEQYLMDATFLLRHIKESSTVEDPSSRDRIEHLINYLEREYTERIYALINRTYETGYKELKTLQDEVKMAQKTQQDLIPEVLYVDYLESHIFYQSLGAVSGDFYNFFHHEDGTLDIFLGDAIGHGIPAAFLSMLVIGCLACMDRKQPPSEIIKKLNSVLEEHTSSKNFITGIYMRITSDGAMTYCSAGHTPVVMISSSGAEMKVFDARGLLLGIFPDVSYHDNTHQLTSGDTMVLFTDGIYEWQREDQTMVGEKLLLQLIQKHAGHSVEELIAHVVEDVQQSTQTASHDDLTMMGLRYTG